jgi:diaminopimelate epimerase
MIRTYERGVENETLSCGTGAVASAIVLNILSLLNTEKVILQTKGGDLTVNFKNTNETFSEIYLSGEVVKVFDGKLEI